MNTRTRFLLVGVLAIGGALALDPWAYEHITYPRVYEQDWGRFLRVMGFLPTWFIAAIGLYLHDRGVLADAKRRAMLLAASPAVAGIVGEALKLLLRRERPEAHDGHYFFRAFSDRPFSTGGLALPSSHAIVAFGAAAMLAYLFPRARWVWFSLAVGCAISRVLARAHFLSDVAAAAIVATATAALLWRRFGTPERASPD